KREWTRNRRFRPARLRTDFGSRLCDFRSLKKFRDAKDFRSRKADFGSHLLGFASVLTGVIVAAGISLASDSSAAFTHSGCLVRSSATSCEASAFFGATLS